MSPLRKVKNATKTPKLQIPQNKDYQQNDFSEVLSFSAFVAKKRLFGIGSSN